jgi:hypothetical protein
MTTALTPADLNDEPDSSFSWYNSVPGKLHCVSCKVSPLFHLVECIGYEAAMIAIAANNATWQARVDTVLRALENVVQKTPADLCMICDDIGSAHGSMIGYATFRESYLPMLTRFAELCRRNGKLSAWHSCGRLEELIPALRDSRVNVLRLDQLGLMNVADVRRQLHDWQILWFAPDKRGWPDIAKMTDAYYANVLDAQPAWMLCNPKEEIISGQTEATLAVIRTVRQRIAAQPK